MSEYSFKKCIFMKPVKSFELKYNLNENNQSINAKTFIPQAFQLTFIQTFRKYLGAFDKVEE